MPVWSNNSCGASVVFEQSPETPATLNGIAVPSACRADAREQQFVVFPLVVPFAHGNAH